jgi:hypothetical protein
MVTLGRGTGIAMGRFRATGGLRVHWHCWWLVALVAALPASAGDLSSASFTSRGGHVSAGGAGALTGSTFSGGGSAGQSEAIGPGGSTTTLRTQTGGFWPIVAGAFPSLDADGDGPRSR